MKHLLVLFFLFPLPGVAQRNDTVLKYLDGNLQLTTEEQAVFYGVAVKQPEGWMLYALYPDTTPLLKVHFKDRALKVMQGHYASFYPKHKQAVKGFYDNNKKTGVWQTWYENGYRKDSGAYTNNFKTGTWKQWYENGNPASISSYLITFSAEEMQTMRLTGQVPESGAKDGRFASWYPNGNKESEGLYLNNRMDGVWEWFHENGKRSTLETYSNGTLFDLKCYDTAGKEGGNLCSISKPATLKGTGDFRAFLREQLTWPQEAIKKRIEGTVMVSFSVDIEGKLQGLYISALSPVLRDAVTEFFRTLPDWEPAISHNRVVEWKEYVEIPFYLDD